MDPIEEQVDKIEQPGYISILADPDREWVLHSNMEQEDTAAILSWILYKMAISQWDEVD